MVEFIPGILGMGVIFLFIIKTQNIITEVKSISEPVFLRLKNLFLKRISLSSLTGAGNQD